MTLIRKLRELLILLSTAHLMTAALRAKAASRNSMIHSSRILHGRRLITTSSSMTFLIMLIQRSDLTQSMLTVMNSVRSALSTLQMQVSSHLTVQSSSMLRKSGTHLTRSNLLKGFTLNICALKHSSLPFVREAFLLC